MGVGPSSHRGSSPLAGREAELARIALWLEEGGPFLTLLGPPGIGKSRLAGKAAEEEGSLWVDLRGAGDDDVLARIADAAGVTRVDLASVARALRSRIHLLVLDDCDDARAGARASLPRLLGKVPALRVLSTSRRPLGVEGETTMAIEGLAAPRPDEPLESSPAGKILFARARAVRADWAIAPGDEPFVRVVLHRVGALPLAIELVAPQLVELGARAIADRLDRPLDFLVGGDAGDDAGLRATLAHSFAALPDEARALLVRTVRLARPFDADDAEVLAGRGALALLRALREASWLTVERGAYDVLAPLSHYVLEASPALDDAAELVIAEAIVRGALRGRSSPLDRLEPAIRRSASEPRLVDAAVSALVASYPRFAAAGAGDRYGALADELGGLPGMDAHRPSLARVAARAAIDAGRFEEALRAIDRFAASPGTEHDAQLLRARLRFRTGDYEALATLEASARPTRAEDVELFASAASMRGERTLAVAIYRRALERAAASDRAVVRASLARLLVEIGDGAAARAELDLAEATEEADPRVIASLVTTRAMADHDEGRWESAIAGYERALALYSAMGNVLAAYLRFARALASLEAGREEEACACFLAALDDVPPEMSQLRPLVELGRWVAFSEPPPPTTHDRSVVSSSAALVRAFVGRCVGTADASAVEAAVRANEPHATWSVISRVLARLAREGPMGARRTSTAAALLVGGGGSWFAVTGGPQVSLASRPVLARVLGHLADRAERSPGARSTIDDVAAAAWPGERILASAKKSRVYVAIATLRNLGLRTHLSSVPNGYRIDLPVRRAP